MLDIKLIRENPEFVRQQMAALQDADAPLDKVTSAGNAAGTGARIALLNRAARDAIEATVHEIHKVETAIEPRFQEHFVNANAIPHATDAFPHLSGVVTLPQANYNLNSGEGRRRRR